jgi:UDP-N-acetylglucosamine--N-acetylmuramyl-(pentapeptide) pyrophosphoryl-undecaprenol N-acetylglucosamine transferase
MATLLVSSVGGHLSELLRLIPRLEQIDEERQWVTFDTPQSRSLLRDEQVVYLDYTRARDFKNVVRHSRVAARMLQGRHPFSSAISTGSGIALSFLPLASRRGASCHYIESFTRSSGPSLTGRLLSHVPGVSVYSQYPAWAHAPWRYAGSVFDSFVAEPEAIAARPLTRAVVTVGTMERYSFRRLIERALAVLPREVEVLWQTGWADVSDLPIEGHAQLPEQQLRTAIERADVVIAHAGCGSALTALEVGKMPVLVPRSAAYDENIDDHQQQLADELERRGLVITRTPEHLRLEDLRTAARAAVDLAGAPAPFALEI